MRRRASVMIVGAAIAVSTGWLGPASATPRSQAPPCVEHEPVAGAASRGRWVRDLVTAPKHDRLSSWIRRNQAAADRAAARVGARGAPITVPVWFHVIRRDRTLAGGNVRFRRIHRQIEVLNDSFSGAADEMDPVDTGFRFELRGVTRTTNQRWFKLGGVIQGDQERKMKRTLRRGGLRTLNIYSTRMSDGLLGFAYLASSAAFAGVLDGVVVHFQSLPGGKIRGYNGGDTTTHEVGHWFDLLHTFEGGCGGEGGDHVDDTPAEKQPASGCPVGRDTCPGKPGDDPIHNFMDYSTDVCMHEFTADQAERMQMAWEAYRA